MPKLISDPDDASAGRKFRKGEPNIPEQLGSDIRVDGKRVKPLLEESRKPSPPEDGYEPTGFTRAEVDKIKADAAESAARADQASRTNAMGDTYKKGGMTASSRADGIAQRGKTRGTIIK